MSLANYYTEKNTYIKVSNGRLQGILKLLGNVEGKTLLDIGCGGGEVGRRIKEDKHAKVYGADVSPNAVEVAKKVLDGAVVFDVENDTHLPEVIRNISFDTLILSEVLEHLFEPELFLQSIQEKIPAPLVITVPNILFWRSRLKILFGSFEYTNTGMMDRGHIHFFSWKSLQDTIEKGGYSIESTSHHVPTRGTKFLSRVWPGLFCYQFIVKITPNR